MDIQNSQLFSGLQLVNATNKTHTTREGYVSERDYDENIPTLEFIPGEINDYTGLLPGIYKIEINGIMYAFLLHNVLSPADHVVIKNEHEMTAWIDFQPYKLYPYILHSGQIVEDYGHILNHTVNDFLEIYAVDGKTKLPDEDRSLDNPKTLEYISMLNILTTKSNGEVDEYILNMKNYLKSIDTGYPEDRRNICDTLYIDAAKNRALFIFRLGRLIFTGNETFIHREEYDNDEYKVFFYPNNIIKPNGRIQCSCLKTISWNEMIDTSYFDEGICAGSFDEQGFWFKVYGENIFDINSFKAKLGAILDIGFPLTVTYELNEINYTHSLLNDYKINTYFNKQWIMTIPYKSPIKHSGYHDNNPTIHINNAYNGIEPMNDGLELYLVDKEPLVAEMEKDKSIWDNLAVSADINLRTMYFYKHLRIKGRE